MSARIFLVGDLTEAKVCRLEYLLFVDRVRHRLAQLLIIKGRPGYIEGEAPEARMRGLGNVDPLDLAVEYLFNPGIRGPLDHFDVSGSQSGKLHGRIPNDYEHHLVDESLLSPVVY